MLPQQLFADFSNKLAALFAGAPAHPLQDIERNLKALLTSLFDKMDLVTRAEFDIQTELLARTQEKMAALEARIAELEKQHPAQI